MHIQFLRFRLSFGEIKFGQFLLYFAFEQKLKIKNSNGKINSYLHIQIYYYLHKQQTKLKKRIKERENK